MDFEEWLRAQLQAEPAAAGSPRPRRRASRSPLTGFPVAATVAAVGVLIAGGLLAVGAAQLGLQEEHLASAAAAPALPVTTWAGTPPPPPSRAEDRPESAPAATSGTTGAAAASGPPAAAIPPQRQGQSVAEAPPAAPPSKTQPATFAMVGGTATISCAATGPSLVSAVPNPGYQEELEVEDGGAELSVRFRSSSHESRVDAMCVAGAVQGRVQESAS